jgi:Lar family restriction alleviation protein
MPTEITEPCPFCGATPVLLRVWEAEHTRNPVEVVRCVQCETRGPIHPEKDAIAAWNERAKGDSP